MKKLFVFILILSFYFFCYSEELPKYIPKHLVVKFNNLPEDYNFIRNENGNIITGFKSFDEINEKYAVIDISKVFNYIRDANDSMFVMFQRSLDSLKIS